MGKYKLSPKIEVNQEKLQSKVILNQGLALGLLNNGVFYRSLVLALLFGICTLVYYLGELLDLVGWIGVRRQFLDQVHDIHRLLFLAPIMYACHFYGMKAMLIVSAASLVVFLPRAIFVSPFPDAIARSLIFTVFAAIICSFIRIARNKFQLDPSVDYMVGNNSNEVVGVGERIEEGVFNSGLLEVDFGRRLVKLRKQIVKLTPKEYELLAYMVHNYGKVLTHRELLIHVWGSQYGNESEYIRNYIAQLRRKIEDNPSNPQFIVTESRFGYRFLNPENPK